jgi:hypothetical protein
VGRVKGSVTFHGKRVPEEATLQSFFAPGPGLSFLAIAQSPMPLKILWTAEYGYFGDLEGFGSDLIVHAPLVQTSRGAPDVSVEEVDFDIGAARLVRRYGKPRRLRPIYYLGVPTHCPRGGFPFKSELTFAGIGDLPQETVSTLAFARCPRK